MNNKKRLVLIILLILTVLGTTYAVYTWAGKTFIRGTSECFEVNYVKGRDIGSNGEILQLGASALDGLAASIEVGLKSSCSITSGKGILYLDIDTSTSDILLSSGALKYQIWEGNSITKEGILSTKGRNTLIDNMVLSSETKSIIVIVWLDGSLVTEDNLNEISTATFSGRINLEVESRRA